MNYFARPRAASILEVVLGLPVLLVIAMGIIQLGLLQANQQPVLAAARAASLRASEIVVPNSGAVPAEVVDEVNAVLRTAEILGPAESITTIGAVRIDHSGTASPPYGASAPFMLQEGVTGCDPPPTDYPQREFVQVTVCVPVTRLTPNLLNYFGIDYSNRFSSQTALSRHE